MSVAGIAETTQYLTFTLGDEIFALNIENVREVLEFTTVTKVPRTPEYMCGVINLRGGVVPVINLRLKLGMTDSEKTVDTSIIIADVSSDCEKIVIGVLVDSVQEVINIASDHINPVPKIGTKLRTDFIRGIGGENNNFIMILDIEKIFSASELIAVDESKENISQIIEKEV